MRDSEHIPRAFGVACFFCHFLLTCVQFKTGEQNHRRRQATGKAQKTRAASFSLSLVQLRIQTLVYCPKWGTPKDGLVLRQ